MADDAVSSISGGSSSSESDGGGGGVRRALPPSLAAKLVFATPTGELFALWRACVVSPADGKGGAAAPPPSTRLASLRASPGDWLLLLARGGHVAALVLRMSAHDKAGGPSGSLPPSCVIAHKTFHRYVVRAKQGGRQSVKDAGGKAIHSAGSALRRANEAALQRDVRALLSTEWSHHVASASIVWLSVSEADRRSIVGDGAPIAKGDARLRSVPFQTRRPTLAEAKRAASRLACVDLGVVPAEESESEGEEGAHAAAAAAAAAVSSETPLHAAARAGDAALVARLLESGADPTVVSSSDVLPYDVAASRASRDAFRLAAGRPGVSWDWLAAGISSPLTAEAAAAAAARGAARAAAKKAAAAAAAAEAAEAAAARRAAAQEAEARDAAAAAAAASGAVRPLFLFSPTFPPHFSPLSSHPISLSLNPTRFSPGTGGKAAALLGAARAKEAAAREARAAAAERRFGGAQNNTAQQPQRHAAAPAAGAAPPGGGGGGVCGGGRVAAGGGGGGDAPQQTAAALSSSVTAAAAAASPPPSAAAIFGTAASRAPAFGSHPQPSATPTPTPSAAASASASASSSAAAAAAAAALASSPLLTASRAGILSRVLSNVAAHPRDPKFRRLRLDNPKVADSIVDSGALDGLLIACLGWRLDEAGASVVVAEGDAVTHAERSAAAAAVVQARADAG